MRFLSILSVIAILSACGYSNPQHQIDSAIAARFTLIHAAPVISLDWKNGTGYIAAAQLGYGDLYIVDILTNTQDKVMSALGAIDELSWCGNSLLGGSQQLWVWNLDSSQSNILIDEWSDYYYYAPIAWNAGCTIVATVHRTMAAVSLPVQILNLTSLSQYLVDVGDRSPTAIAWKPNSNLLAIGFDHTNEVAIYNIDESRVSKTLSGSVNFPLLALEWSSNGNYLAIAYQNKISIWDSINWQNLRDINLPTGNLYQIRWHPNDKYIASVSESGTSIWNVLNGTQTVAQDSPAYSLDWSTNGDQIAIGGVGTIQVLDVVSWPN